MILFWNNTYYGSLANHDNVTDEPFRPYMTYYYVVNYLVGLVFISSFCIGVSLNPFIIMFNWSKRQSAISLLFVITASADMLVSILIPLFYASLMVQPRIIFYNYMYEMYIVCIMCTFGCTSQVTTSLLGVVRLIKVLNPFYKINNKYLVIYCLLHVGYMFVQVIFIIMLILGKLENHKNILHKLVLACFIISTLHCILGSACSAITVGVLLRSTASQDDDGLVSEKLRSSVTILLMNLPHFITAGCIFTSLVLHYPMSWFDINFIFCPILTATLNPLLIVSRGSAIRCMIASKFHLAKARMLGLEGASGSSGYHATSGGRTASSVLGNSKI